MRRGVSRLLWIAGLLIWTICATGQGERPSAKPIIRYICLPTPGSAASRPPTVTEISAFLQNNPAVQNTLAELLRDPQFGRWVIGQKQTVKDVALFQRAHPEWVIQIRFLEPAEWFDQLLAEYRNVKPGTALVVQIGDTWERYFVDRGMLVNMGSQQSPLFSWRYFYDVRFIWYWKDHVKPEDLATGQSLLRAIHRLQEQKRIPLAISRLRDFDLFWNFYLWLQAAGGNVVKIDTKFFMPWTEAVVANAAGMHAIDYLSQMTSNGGLALPAVDNIQLTEDFLNHSYEMVVMEPWVAWRAQQRWGKAWNQKIGAALLPDITGDNFQGTGRSRRTFIGGFLLGIMAPNQGSNAPCAQGAAAWINYLTNQPNPQIADEQLKSLQYIPGSDRVWAMSAFKPFFDEAMGGDSSPARLETLRPTWSPPVLSDTPTLETRTSDYFEEAWNSVLRQRPDLAKDALRSAQETMNEKLSPGIVWPRVWLAVYVCITGIVAASVMYLWRKRIEAIRERRWWEKVARHQAETEELTRQIKALEQIVAVVKLGIPYADSLPELDPDVPITLSASGSQTGEMM